jgi:hypothetical protein
VQPLDLNHVQNPSARGSRIAQQILERHPQNIAMIVRCSKLMEQNDLPALGLAAPESYDLLPGNPLQ